MSLDELKCAAAEIKCLRPIQEAIVGYFQLSTWEDVTTEFGSTVLPEELLQFAVSNHFIPVAFEFSITLFTNVQTQRHQQ